MTMRPLGALLQVEQAWQALQDVAVPVSEVESIDLHQALDRVLAEDVSCPRDVPPFDRAAMDGYALRAEDTPGRLRCVEVVYAGGMPSKAIGPGECMEVATGAPVPEGSNAVLKVEDTSSDADWIDMRVAVRVGQSVTRRGADMHAGDLVVKAGTLLNPSRIGAVAAAGQRQVRVYRRPRVKVASTGNEIVEPGESAGPHQIYNINAYTLAALLRSAGCEVDVLPVIPDDLAELKRVIQGGLDADLIVISGGSSVGVKDLMIDAVGSLGEVLFHGVAIKPGKPTMLGLVAGTPVIGMPGYPTSCLSNGYIFLLPLVARLGHRAVTAARRQTMPLAARIQSEAGKFQVYTVRVVDGQAQPAFKESGVISSMSNADGYILIPVDVTVLEPGTPVEVVFF